MLKGSRPARRNAFGFGTIGRGGTERMACAIALMCSGVVPQQPPTMFSQPLLAHSPIWRPMDSGVSSYSPKAFGRPAFGWQETAVSARPASSST